MIKVNDCPKVFISRGLNKALVKAGKNEENLVHTFAEEVHPYIYGPDSVIKLGKTLRWDFSKFDFVKKLTMVFKQKVEVSSNYNKTFRQKIVSNISVDDLKNTSVDDLDKVLSSVHKKVIDKMSNWYNKIEKNWNKDHCK